MENKFKVGDRIQLTEVVGYWTVVGERGTITAILSPQDYAVKFDVTGAGSVAENQIDLIEPRE